MKIIVERSDLVANGACHEGIRLFDTLAPSGTWSGEWTALHAAWLARDRGPLYSWCFVRNILPSFPRGANLRNADLRLADLRGHDMRGVNLRNADLRDADLRDVDLRHADLRGTDLRGAIVNYALFNGAVFGNTIMPNGTVR